MSIILDAKLREDKGKGASRRLKKQNKVPAILYGLDKDPTSLEVDFFTVTKETENNESLFTSVLELKIGSKKEKVIFRDVQRHPAKGIITHIDFLRIDSKQLITIHIPFNFTNQSESNALNLGAILTQLLPDVEISCLPSDLPEAINIDVSQLEIGDSVLLSDIKLSKGVKITVLQQDNWEEFNQAVVSITEAAKFVEEDEESSEVTDESTEDKSSDNDSESK